MKLFGATAVIRVDDEDYEKVLAYQWHITDRGYVQTYTVEGEKRTKLHNLILPPPEGYEVDHINGNKLDNRKENLRHVTRAQNCWNSSRKKNGASQYKGVHWDKRLSMWRPSITCNGKTHHGRRTNSEEQAARWYDMMAKKLHGEYAYLNFPDY